MHFILSVIAVSFFFFCSPAVATNICWIEEVVQIDDVLRIRLMENYRHAVRSVKHPDGKYKQHFDTTVDFFEMHEGDQAIIATSHNSCIADSMIRDGNLGIKLTSTSCLPGLPCNEATQFIIAK